MIHGTERNRVIIPRRFLHARHDCNAPRRRQKILVIIEACESGSNARLANRVLSSVKLYVSPFLDADAHRIRVSRVRSRCASSFVRYLSLFLPRSRALKNVLLFCVNLHLPRLSVRACTPPLSPLPIPLLLLAPTWQI